MLTWPRRLLLSVSRYYRISHVILMLGLTIFLIVTLGAVFKRERPRKFDLLDFYDESLREDLSLSALPNPYHINNKDLCTTETNLTAVFLINSAPYHYERRMSIRRTWGDMQFFKPREIRVAFTLGQPQDDSIQEDVEEENRKFNDILQGRFDDSYENLVHKSVLSMRWASEHCLNSKMIVKMDDDTFVNMFKFLEDVDKKYSKQSQTIYCYAKDIGTSPIQRSGGEWTIGNKYFKDMTHFPFVHCNGFFVAMTPDVPPLLYETARVTPILRHGDVYLTGVIPTLRGDVIVKNMASLSYDVENAKRGFELSKRCFDVTAITPEDRTVLNMIDLWKFIMSEDMDTQTCIYSQ